MTSAASARSPQQRRHDVLRRLEHDVDAWVATAAEDGAAPHLVPLSFVWDGATLLVATPATSPTGSNLRTTGVTRLGIGPTDDRVLVEGTAVAVPPAELPEEDAEIFAGKTGFDPRLLAAPYLFFRILPRRIQAWRTPGEGDGRELMRDGEWLVGD
ncbi:pyridoxamine 5'-phosphate oxidase family protein [Streptomyces sp. NPDC051315]|uniref:pyridoxamine 5'-phosphate oxidase family protein n=1 Tax=Streptomyces sp. NPDC051315 TaxID=3365650 RepID=UPI00379F48A3